MAKKGQYAVPAMLVAMAAFLIIYLILVYPSEKQELLGFNITEKNVSDSPLGPDTELLFSSGEIAEIGRSSGQSVFRFSMDNFYVNYPAEEKVLDTRDITLRASALSDNAIDFAANNLNLESTKEIAVRLNTTDVKGSPKLVVFLNDSRVFERVAEVGELNIRIPQTLLKENNPIILKLEHNGPFWSSQNADITVDIVQVFYNPRKPTSQQYITLGQSNIQGSEVRISFLPVEAVDEGELLIKVNDKVFFSGTVPEAQTFSAASRFDDSGIQVGENQFLFEADKGGVYNLTNVKLEFIAVAAPSAIKTYSFDIKTKDLESDRDIVLGIKVDRIIEPGYIYARIGAKGPVYYFSNADLASGAWSYAELDKDYLTEFGNKITIDSPDGRHRVTGLIIVLV